MKQVRTCLAEAMVVPWEMEVYLCLGARLDGADIVDTIVILTTGVHIRPPTYS